MAGLGKAGKPPVSHIYGGRNGILGIFNEHPIELGFSTTRAGSVATTTQLAGGHSKPARKSRMKPAIFIKAVPSDRQNGVGTGVGVEIST